jgi:hypothetical protein
MKPKRILIITDMPVWPPFAGDKARAWALMNNLRRLGHEVSFLGLGLSQEPSVEALTARWGAGIHNIRRVRARWEKPRFQATQAHCPGPSFFMSGELARRGWITGFGRYMGTGHRGVQRTAYV